ncbi:MAG: class F sortase [Candidatus Saccharibacteria bacterium]|nr:class F sortase [Candidatus Saccharibacteria bacterium]
MSENKQAKTETSRSYLQKALMALVGLLILFALGCLVCNRYRNQLAEQAREQRDEALGISSEEVSSEDKKKHHVDSGDKPRLISIAKAGVNQARIQEVGLLAPSADGSQQMDVPKNIHDVGWYNCQINPIVENRCDNYVAPASDNTVNATVMDGHSCGGAATGCVFDKVGQLTAGDEIVVEIGNGSTVTYVIDLVEIVDLADVDMTKVMKPYQKDTPGLNLITCDGTWTSRDSRGVTTMNKRIVVYSSLKQ